jgi:hypothetical protein
MSDQPDAETSLPDNTTLTKDRYPCPLAGLKPPVHEASGLRPTLRDRAATGIGSRNEYHHPYSISKCHECKTSEFEKHKYSDLRSCLFHRVLSIHASTEANYSHLVKTRKSLANWVNLTPTRFGLGRPWQRSFVNVTVQSIHIFQFYRFCKCLYIRFVHICKYANVGYLPLLHLRDSLWWPVEAETCRMSVN